MGTLYDQQSRGKHDGANQTELLSTLKMLMDDHDMTMANAIEFMKVLEMNRTNNLYRNNGDAWDEQIAGIGKIMESISDAIRSNSDNL
jgi:hypothetical protein